MWMVVVPSSSVMFESPVAVNGSRISEDPVNRMLFDVGLNRYIGYAVT